MQNNKKDFFQSVLEMLHKERLSSWFSIIAGVLAVIGTAVISIFPIFRGSNLPSIDDLPKLVVSQSQEIQILKKETDSLYSIITQIKALQNDIKTPDEKVRKEYSLRKIETSLASVQQRLSEIEGVILDNPSKALNNILLRKDFDNLKITNQAEVFSIRQELERIYDLNKWLIGLLFTLALGILSLAITNIFRSKSA